MYHKFDRYVKTWVEYIAFGNFIIAFCAVSLTWQTTEIILDDTDPKMLLLVFSATLSSYCFHAYFKPTGNALTERILWIQQHRKFLLILSVLSLFITFCILFFLPGKWLPILILAIFTFIYSLPRLISSDSFILKWIIYLKTIYLAIIWTIVTSLLPLYIDGIEWSQTLILIVTYHFLLIFQLCMLFEYKDRCITQKDNNILFFRPFNLDLSFYLSLTGMLLLSFCFYNTGGESEHLFSMLLPVVYLTSIYRKSKVDCTDAWYSLAVDATMIIPGLFLLISYLLK
ncbi:MAG: hypothetical protein IPH45_01490 [Bacteroidales bacterium]|nr:hypothetical protein [Bacteroidales bacterium]